MSKAKFIPLEKQSKKKQREYFTKHRKTWNGIVPVTRLIPNKKQITQEHDISRSYILDD